MELLEIITTEDHLTQLRQISKKLSDEEIKSPQIQTFIDNLLYTAQNIKMPEGWESVGLAAIQVNNPIQIFLAKDVIHGHFNIFINPEIEYLGNAKDIRDEHCFSIVGVSGPVERYKRIRIKYKDREGVAHSEKFEGFNARVIQHEYDHLFGELFTDKVV